VAENEVLDLGASRWRRTRAAMAEATWPLAVIAVCVAEDLTGSLRLQLSKAFHQGQTLLTILRAAGSDRIALRAAVECFCGQGLARTTRDAIKFAPSNEPGVIAKLASDLLIDSCIDKVSGFSGRYDRFQTQSDREELRTAVRQRLEVCRSDIAAVIEASLRGQEVCRQRRSAMDPARQTVDARALIPDFDSSK
jgi:hypothetical protein